MIPVKDRLYLGTIATLLLIILFLRMCSGHAPCPKTAEIVKHDTAWMEHSDSSGWIRPKPVAIISVIVKHDTLELSGGVMIKYRDVDTAAILRDYYATRVYIDTAGTEYGDIFLQDSISQNRIKARRWKTDFHFPVITNTVQAPPPGRWQVYAGFSLSGNKETLLNGFGPELLLKTPRDKIYGAGAQFTQGGQLFYHGSVYFKLNLHKH